jgi:hypothetical protein
MRGLRRLLRVLRHRDFRLLWLGQATSSVGDAVIVVALALFIVDLTGSATDLGAVLAAYRLPLVAFLLVGGVLADRLPRHRVVVATDLVRFTLHALLAILIVTGAVRIWHIAVIGMLFGTAEAFFRPAVRGLLPQTVPEPRSRRPAPSRRRRTTSREPAAGLLRKVRAGFHEVRSRAWIWATLAAFCVALFFVLGPWYVLGPIVAREQYGTSPSTASCRRCSAPAWSPVRSWASAGARAIPCARRCGSSSCYRSRSPSTRAGCRLSSSARRSRSAASAWSSSTSGGSPRSPSASRPTSSPA